MVRYLSKSPEELKRRDLSYFDCWSIEKKKKTMEDSKIVLIL